MGLRMQKKLLGNGRDYLGDLSAKRRKILKQILTSEDVN
jgi:hypothetical protein